MKNSLWLQKYENEVANKRNESNQNKKVILIIIPIMAVLFLIPALANSNITDPQVLTGTIAMVGVFAVTILFAVIMISIGKKKDVTKLTRENVLKLLKSDEDVDRFDQQMSIAPMGEVNLGTETLFFTEDYVGKKFIAGGDLKYTFIRRSEIASFHHSKTASNTANPINAAFFFDIRNANQQVIMNGSVDSGKQLDELVALLQTAQPEIQLG